MASGNPLKNIDIGLQTCIKMKKAQTQTQSNKQEVISNTSIVKLKAQINALKSELDSRSKKYADNVLEFNVKINELEERIERINAQNSDKTIKLISKINELEDILLKKQDDDLKNQRYLEYRANKLDEYELKIHHLEDTIKKLEDERIKKSENIERKLFDLQQITESKSDKTIKSIEGVLSCLKIIENKNRESEVKTPAVMESLIRMLKNTEENYQKLQDRTSVLEVNYKMSLNQIDTLKSMLFNTIISRYNFFTFLAEMFGSAVKGLIADLYTVLPYLSQPTKPSENECVNQIDILKREYNKYIALLDDLKIFRQTLDEKFSKNDFYFNMDYISEFKIFHIPVSILHLSYLPMLHTSRQQNQFNAVQMRLAYQQLNAPTFTANNAPRMAFNNFGNTAMIEDISNQNQSENSISNNLVVENKFEKENQNRNSDEKIVSESLDGDNLSQEHFGKNNNNKENFDEEFSEKKIDENLPKIKPFKLCYKNTEFIPSKRNIFHVEKPDFTTEDISSNQVDNLIKTNTSITVENSAENNLLNSETFSNETESKNSISSKTDLINSKNTPETQIDGPDNIRPLSQMDIEPIDGPLVDIHENRMDSPTSTCKSLMETTEGVDISVLDKLGGSNRLVKLYFYVKDKGNAFNTSDEELVNAILAVRKEHTLHGMRKKDILAMIMEFLKKQKDAILENTTPKDTSVSFCVICFDSNEFEPSKSLSCNHRFHISCLQRWFQTDNICPVCRILVVIIDD